jgi:hypothetical protein
LIQTSKNSEELIVAGTSIGTGTGIVVPKRKIIFMEGAGEADADKSYKELVDSMRMEPSSLDLPQGYLSVSQVNMYLRCAKSYEWRYVKKQISPPLARMSEGTAIHKALEVAHNERKRSRQAASLSTILDAYHQSWQAQRAEIEYEDESEQDIIKRDETFIRLYHREFVPKIVPEQVEMEFWVALTEHHIPVRGFIDLIDSGEEDGMHTIVDHKVVQRAKPAQEVQNDMQMTLYTHAVSLPKARFDMFIKTKTPRIDSLRTVRTSNDIRWVEKVFNEVALGINKGVFPPCSPTNWMCNEQQCGYYSRCRGA